MITESGDVEIVGRIDNQVKIRGHRIELGEIETAFNTNDLLQECAVVAIPTSGFDGHAICLAYVAKPNSQVSPLTLRKFASEFLPKYMLHNNKN